jgi:hypothetical protein
MAGREPPWVGTPLALFVVMAVEAEFPRLAIVRRDQAKVYDWLRQKYGGELTVVWDRRARERRLATGSASPDRRSRERRYRPPPTWRLGFLIVPRTRAHGGGGYER